MEKTRHLQELNSYDRVSVFGALSGTTCFIGKVPAGPVYEQRGLVDDVVVGDLSNHKFQFLET